MDNFRIGSCNGFCVRFSSIRNLRKLKWDSIGGYRDKILHPCNESVFNFHRSEKISGN